MDPNQNPQPAQTPPPAPPQQVAPSTAPPQVPVTGQVPQPGAAPAPPPKGNPNSTQNSLLIAEIRDGLVIMQDGSFRAVVLSKSINFDLMSPQEREGVEYAYQGFLNSLYFPIQIFIRSKKVDLRQYLTNLDKLRSEQDNMLLGLMMEDYIQFINVLSQETNIMDKQFYIVIPFYPSADAQKAVQKGREALGGIFKRKQTVVNINEADLEKAKSELSNRVQAVLNGLMQFGVQAIPLDTQELIELYYDSYNPDTATTQRLTNFDSLNAPVIQKGEGDAPQPHLDQGIN